MSAPVLVFVHGTGDGAELDDYLTTHFLEHGMEFEFADHRELFEHEHETIARWEGGDRWWQTEGHLSRQLAAWLVGRDGQDLADRTVVRRFLWSGANLEAERDQAAYGLRDLLQHMADRDQSIHILAHSHGGNVVRRALELGDRPGRPALGAAIRTITCFGTPFFRYARRARQVSFMLNSGIAILTAFALAALRTFPTPAYRLWLGLPILLIFVLTLGKVLKSGYDAFLSAQRKPSKSADGIIWRNYCSARDEAVALLASLNRRVPLMRAATRSDGGPLSRRHLLMFVGGLLVLWAVGAAIGPTAHRVVGRPFGLPEALVDGVMRLGLIAVGLAALAVVVLALLKARSLFLTYVDHLVTVRLRALAFGDPRGIIVGVDTAPWPGMAEVMRPLPAEVDAAVEGHIQAATGGLWAQMRKGLKPSRSLVEQDIGAAVRNALTWDELAHTVYARVDTFVLMVARDLVHTGDWRWRNGEPELSPPHT